MSDVVKNFQELVGGLQHNRILRLSFPRDDGPPAQMLVNRLDAFEGISRDFEYIVEILSDDANIELKALQGKLLCVELVRRDGSLRYFTGYCFAFRLKRADGAIAFYEAKLGPWFKFLSLRTNNYLFHNKSLREQTEIIFEGYASLPVWDWFVAGDEMKMTDACQFGESDHNYLSRRWEAAGLLYAYEHSADGHKLVVKDSSIDAPAIDGDVEIPYQRHGGSQEEDAIFEWSPMRQLVPARVTLSRFDFKNPVQSSRCTNTMPTRNRQGAVPEIESYEYVGAYGFKNVDDGDRVSGVRMDEIDAVAKHYDGASNSRNASPLRWCRLTGYFDNGPPTDDRGGDQNEFLILEVHHSVTNNYLQQADIQAGYTNRLVCIRRSISWRPGRGFNSMDTKILAPQTATVVGPGEAGSIHVDDYMRTRVQFHWDRVGTFDDGSSAWLRIVGLWAGDQFGATAIPRVGSEVCVMFLDGNPDRPIIIGALPNQHNMPPWELPSQQALTGLRSRELAADGGSSPSGRSNHLILDDTHKAIQAQLKSDHEHSQLSLGHITRVDDNAGRKDARGEGWELATGGWGVARASKGMLLTTEARPGAQAHIKDMGETVRRLDAASDLHGALAALARNHDAQGKTGQQEAVADVLHAQTAAVRGESKDNFPELSQPHLVLASPAGIELTTAGSTHVASEQHAAITTGKSMSIASRDSLFASIGNALRVFVHKAGMMLVAAAGKVRIQAQSDDVEIIAQKVLALLSESDWVEIRGKKGVRLHGANSMLEVGEQTQFFTPAPVLFHGNLETLLAKSVSQSMNERATTRFDQQVRLLQVDSTPAPHIAYELIHEDGHLIDGKTPACGSTPLQKGTGMDSYTIRYKGELP
jgi:type VI secretion system secreted protein VgrG